MVNEVIDAEVAVTDWAWLAGFIDGEGSIGLNRERDKRKGPDYFSYRPMLQITQVDGRVLSHAAKLMGARYTRLLPHSNPNARPQHHVSLRNGEQLMRVLNGIAPYLHLKLPQAVWLATYLRNRAVKYGTGRRAPYTAGDALCYEQLRELNKRGVSA